MSRSPDARAVVRMRAGFGLAYVAVGLVLLWRLALTGASPGQKVLGLAFAVVAIGLGLSRVLIWWRARRRGEG